MTQYDVIGMGIASWDLIGVATNEPLLGAKQPVDSWLEASGGPVATALVTLARLGMRTSMLTAVGNDAYGERIRTDLVNEGVDVDALMICPGSSHVAFVLVEPASGRRTVWWHNDRTVLDKVPLDRHRIESARALHLDTHLPEQAVVAARWMHEAGGLVMIDAERYRETTKSLLPYCHAIVVSERFAREATGEADVAEAARALFDRYPTMVVVTAGERGNWCIDQNEMFHTPAFSVDVVDTTGAGDVFHGALLYGILQQWHIRDAVRFASATAALKCRSLGGRAGIPRLNEVQDFLRSKDNLTPPHGNTF